MARNDDSKSPDSAVSAAYARSLLDHLRVLGVDPTDMFSADQIAKVEREETHSEIPFPSWLAMLDRAMGATDDPDLALKVGEGFRIRHLGHVGYVLMSCSTLEDAVEQAERYLRLIGGVGGTRVARHGERAELRFEWTAEVTPPAVERIFAAASATLSRWLSGRPDLRWDACFRCERPADLRNYERIFGGEIRFAQAETKLSFQGAYLDLPVASANPEIHDLVTAQAEAMLRDLSDEPEFLRKVRIAISRDLAAGRASLAGIAEALDLSTRTLHRRLEEHGFSFREVMREVRCARAEAYLRDPTISLAEVAFMLGYGEQSTFQNAFKRWVGITPGEFRAREL